MDDTFDSSRVLWKATLSEQHFSISHENGTDLTCYGFALVLNEPLKEEHMRTTLQLLYRKCPNLRVCQKYDKTGQLWICEMKEERILLDFSSEISNDLVEEVAKETKTQHEVTTGPMWRVKVTRARNLGNEDKVVDVLERQANSFMHKYFFLLAMHHTITDGHSTVRLCGFMLSILNDVISGKTSLELDDGSQLAEFVSNDRTMQVLEKIQETLKKNPEISQNYQKSFQDYLSAMPLLFQVFPGVPFDDSETLTARRKLSETVSSNFFRKAKSMGISVHSALNSAINAAIIDILVECGRNEKTIEITSMHIINYRRYWDCDSELLFGAHVGPLLIISNLPYDMKKNFWGHSHKFHEELQQELKNNASGIFISIGQFKPARTVEEFRAMFKRASCNFVMTNMGDITRFFKPKNGLGYEHARIVDCHRSSKSYQGLDSACFRVHTLNGELHIGFDYNTHYFLPTLAENLLNCIIQIIADVSN